MPRKKNTSIVVSKKQGSLQAELLLQLADDLDPPRNVIDLSAWEEPPDIADWAHSSYVDATTNRLVNLAEHQVRLLRTILKMIWAKKVDTVVWSEIKKSGKTAVAGLVGAYWANFVEAPNEVISIANDQEQAQGRIYAAMMPTMKKLGWDVPDQKPLMMNTLSGSRVKAIGTSYEGEAGGNYGLTLWSELWAYKSERRKRLWDEMTQVPTRRFSVRWVETYAGFLSESDLLWGIYCKAFKNGKEEEPLGQRVVGLEDLPIWYLESSKTLVYWSHEPRMPWQTSEFMESQRNAPGMRPSTFRRLWQNYWVSSEEVFILPEQWDALDACEPLNEDGDIRPLFLGADASISNDSTALVATAWNVELKAPEIVAAWEWRPEHVEGSERKIVDLSATIEKKIGWLIENFNVLGVFYDEYQLHAIMTNLKKKYDEKDLKKLFENFPQSSGRTMSDQAFYEWIVNKQLRRVNHARLREHVLNAVAKATDRGYRLDKAATSQKIDLAVASSMACYAASIKFRPKRTFVKV